MAPELKKNEDAVSPVIGVILMVAITVILAAVIAMFVFGMATDIGSAKVVGLTVSENVSAPTDADKTVNVLWQGGGDLNQLKNMSGSVDGVAFTEITISPAPAIGVISPINTGHAVSGKRVILVGHFNDGQQQMLFDKYL